MEFSPQTSGQQLKLSFTHMKSTPSSSKTTRTMKETRKEEEEEEVAEVAEVEEEEEAEEKMLLSSDKDKFAWIVDTIKDQLIGDDVLVWGHFKSKKGKIVAKQIIKPTMIVVNP